MPRLSLLLALPVLAATLPALPAAAMDLPPEVYEQSQANSPLGFGNGWYIRGDFGWNTVIKTKNPTANLYDPATTSTSTWDFDHSRMSRDYTVSGGIGYQFTDYLRTDVTADWFKSTFKGRSSWEYPCAVGLNGNLACRYTGADVSTTGILGNAYVDLGTYWGVTPYLGGGAGLSNVKWGQIKDIRVCDTAGGCNGIDSRVADHNGASSWRFTYALMAGMSYDLTNHTKIDLGYRYSHIDGGDMFHYSTFETSVGATGVKGRDKGFDRHEFRAGLRLTSW